MDYITKHKISKATETIRALSVALTNTMNELETEHNIDMYDEILSYIKEKRI